MQTYGRSRGFALVCAAVGFLARAGIAVAGQTADRETPTSPAGRGSIVGVVLNERHEPVARATVQAFPALGTSGQAQGRQNMPPLMRASGSASTDDQERRLAPSHLSA